MRIVKLIITIFLAVSVCSVLMYRFTPVPFTPLMGIRMAQQVSHGELPRCHHKWVPLSEMSKYMPVAVIASEDQLFMSHHGFDFDAIRQAMAERQSGKRQRGGSTISQQTAKNVFLWPGGWVRKALEAYFTAIIELTWPKGRIMEVYLNSIEMGDGIYGLEAVAQAHFGCHASELSRSQCALIAATLPNPRRFSSANPSPYMRKRQHWIERQMRHVPLMTMSSN